MKKSLSFLLWLAVALAGGAAYAILAARHNEPVNSGFILVAALCTYAIGYRFYSKWIGARVLALDDRRATPCEIHEDGKDYIKTNRWIVFGHHFAAISGPGPLVGPVLAAQFGYLPGTLWILIGVVLGGAVQDFVILFASMRRDGRSLGQMVKDELNATAGVIASIAILSIMIILLAVLALVVVKALAESPWGVFTVAATIPIAMLMGGYLRFIRPGKVLEISAVGVVLLLLAVAGGQYVHGHAALAKAFTLPAETLAWSILGYGLLASVLPLWLLLAPRDYLSTFMKLGTIGALALGCFLVLPELRMPAVSKAIDGSGLIVAGKLFPFCFITIACGAISGFHTLISSGVTPKIITRESYARSIGYGAMCLESLVAIMAMIAACTLDPGVYLAMNVKGAGATPAAVVADTLAKVNAQGTPFSVTPERMKELAHEVGEATLYGRTGGAATLAVGMANIFSRVTRGRGLDLWYHFAIMFEALFILTTLDAGTRVGRYLLQDALGHLWKPLGDTRRLLPNILASGLIVGSWGWFLIQGVRDPLGGINSLWPLFGIANQLLAAIALCLGTTVILKMQLARRGNPALAIITLAPLIALVAITFTAGWQKIYDPSPRIGFFAAAQVQEAKLPPLEAAAAAAHATGDPAQIGPANQALRAGRTLRFNSLLDAGVAGSFLVLVTFVIAISIFKWVDLLGSRGAPSLTETAPVFLPESALAGERPLPILGVVALGFAVLKEVSGQSAVDRASVALAVEAQQQAAVPCACTTPMLRGRRNAFLLATERRFEGVQRCC